jgi:hypothetical protein
LASVDVRFTPKSGHQNWPALRSISGSLAIFTAIRRASARQRMPHGPQCFTPLLGIEGQAMRSEYDFENTVQENEDDAAWPKSPEVLIDRFGIRTALFVLCVALFIAAIWLVSRPSFEKCSALENVTERNACFETLRNDLLKPPAKGADVPRR